MFVAILESFIAWLAETFIGAMWRKVFPPKTAESEERAEVHEMDKKPTQWRDTVSKL